MDDTGWFLVILVVVIVILVAVVATINYNTTLICTQAGYDGYMHAQGVYYCYHIVDNTRVLTPMSVIPRASL